MQYTDVIMHIVLVWFCHPCKFNKETQNHNALGPHRESSGKLCQTHIQDVLSAALVRREPWRRGSSRKQEFGNQQSYLASPKNQSMKVTSKDFVKYLELHNFSVTHPAKKTSICFIGAVFNFKFDLGKNSLPKTKSPSSLSRPPGPSTTVLSPGVLLMCCWMGRRTARRTVQRSS